MGMLQIEEIVGIRMKLIKYAAVSLLAMSPVLSQTAHETRSYLKQAAISETAGTVHVVANSPRPLLQILDALREKYGWAANYEDPQFVSKLDLVETGGPGNHVPDPNLPPRVPGGGAFSVEFPAAAPDEEKVLQLVVDSYNRSDNPGRFELRKSKTGDFFVVGAQAHDARGQISHQQVLFDVPITVVAKARTMGETVELICQKIHAGGGVAVTVGVSPRSLMVGTQVTVGGTKVSARDLLLQTLTSTGRKLYWRLLFDPQSKGYYLDIHLIRAS
jgi:hypothetical protein